MKRLGYELLATLIIGMGIYYVNLPPLHLQSPMFYLFIFNLGIVYLVIHSFNKLKGMITVGERPSIPTKMIGVAGGFMVVAFALSLFYSPVIQSKLYANRIAINEDGKFEKEVSIVDFNTLPLLDRDSSMKLGDRVMGQMPEYVSQFSVSDIYSQINYKETVTRVTPLEYNGFFKWFANRDEGVQGYIMVNSVTGSAELEKLEKGLKYVPSAYFNENLRRKLRFSYPTAIFGEYSFEVDDDGNPYWVVPVMKYKGIGMLEDVKGAVLLDPITGSHEYYDVEEVPTWVDHVYPSSLILSQTDDWGSYRNGFLNSIIGQKNVVSTTDGYNYLASNGDIYLYTGITSAASDESILGFILSNLRTKETTFYAVAGATEYSARQSAQGQVQQMSYVASFPLLINLENKPTYLISLKDAAGLVKMYAFVDVQDYQKVSVSDASDGIVAAAKKYVGGNFSYENEKVETNKKTIQVAFINQVNIEDTTFFFILDEEGNKYKVSVKVNESTLPFMKVGQSFDIEYYTQDDLNTITSIK